MAKVIESGGDPFGSQLDPQQIVKNLGDLSKGGSPGNIVNQLVDPLAHAASNMFSGKTNDEFIKRVGNAWGDVVQAPEQAATNLFGGGGGSSKKKKQATTTADTSPPPTGTAPPTVQSPDDVLTAGLGMFFSQYLAPMMTQINSQNNSMINQWGNTMNQLLQQPLPAGVKAIMQPWVAQNAQTLGMINSAAANQVAGQIPFNTLMNQLGQQSSAEQALATALPTAAANQALASGNSQAVGQMLANQGLANTPIGAGILSLLSQPSVLQQLTGSGSGSGSNKNKSQSQANPQQQSVTPIQVLPSSPSVTTTPTTGTQQSTNELANTLYAQQLAQAMLTANQPSAQQANALAGSGYTAG